MFVLPDFSHCLRMTTSSVLGQLKSFGPNESMPPVAFVLSSVLCIYTFLQAACKVKARGLEILFCRQSWSLLFFCCGQYLTLKSLSCLGETWVFVASLVKTGKHLVKGVNGKEERGLAVVSLLRLRTRDRACVLSTCTDCLSSSCASSKLFLRLSLYLAWSGTSRTASHLEQQRTN